MTELQSLSKTKVYIHRDYSDGLAVKFQTRMPEELHGRIDPDVFVQTVQGLNKIYGEAEKSSGYTYFINSLSCLTGYLIYFLVSTPYDKATKSASKFIEQQNHQVYNLKKVEIKDPMRSGLRSMEIIIHNV